MAATLYCAAHAAPALAQETRVTLPEPVSGKPVVAERKDPRKVQYNGAEYEHFELTVLIEETSYSTKELIVQVYADCRANTTMVVSSFQRVDEIDEGRYNSRKEVVAEPVLEDQSKAGSDFGTRNLQAMCRLK